jgi:hypothetical protein
MATYPVPCACGATLEVAGSAAGTTVPCRCGRSVEVPSLVRLKASVGQASVSADFEIEQLLVAGALPVESNCVLCHRPTSNQAKYLVTCEVATVDAGEMPWWQKILVVMAFGVIGFGVYGGWQVRRPSVRGRDVILPLPIRVCPDCVETLTTTKAVRAAMQETDVYARLFEKYPRAAISNAD